MPDLSLDHSWSLRPEHLHSLEDINHSFVTHSLQDDAEGDEDSSSADTGAGNTGPEDMLQVERTTPGTNELNIVFLVHYELAVTTVRESEGLFVCEYV